MKSTGVQWCTVLYSVQWTSERISQTISDTLLGNDFSIKEKGKRISYGESQEAAEDLDDQEDHCELLFTHWPRQPQDKVDQGQVVQLHHLHRLLIVDFDVNHLDARHPCQGQY